MTHFPHTMHLTLSALTLGLWLPLYATTYLAWTKVGDLTW